MKRIPQFDMLRAIAVLLVIGCHLNYNPALSRFGRTGVDLFFCLSGFLISGLLFRDYKSSGEIHCQRFILRRGFKIYPAYYVLVVGTVIFNALVKTPISWNHVWPDLFFVQDYRAGFWAHLWTVGVEEQFYLLLPLCLWLMARKRQADPFRRLPWICGLIAASCLVMRAIQFHEVTPYNHYTHMRPFHLRCDSLAFGVLLSYLNEFRPELLDKWLYRRGHFLLTTSLVCLLPALVLEEETAFLYIFGLTLLYLGYGGILLFSLKCWTGAGLIVRLMSGIGRSSYSIYLWHLPIAWLSVAVLQDRMHWGRNSVFGMYVLASLAVGIGMAHVVEHSALRLREKWFPDLPGNRTEMPATHLAHSAGLTAVAQGR